MLPMDDIAGVLQTLNIDEQTINQLIQMLDEAKGIKAETPRKLNGAILGGSSAAGTLSYHTDLAHQKVAEAIDDLVSGFTALADNVESFKKHAYSVDDGTGQVLTTGTNKVTDVKTIDAAGDCTSSPNVASTTCTLPNGG